MNDMYYPRLLDGVLKKELEAFGAVLIVGPKWCGKTTTAKRFAKSSIEFQDPDNTKNYLAIADTKPSLLLKGDNPRLLDEWQVAPVLWDAVRYDVDRQGKTGLYILTGSTTVKTEQIHHSGAGRISKLFMRTMSLFESQDSNGQVSLSDLFVGRNDIEGFSPLNIERLAYLVVRGGWPSSIGKEESVAIRQVQGYCNVISEVDMTTVDSIKRDSDRIRTIFRALARHVSSLATNQTILDDIGASNEFISENTLSDYIKALKKLYVVEDLQAWSPKLRSKTVIRTSVKREFIDPSIAAAQFHASSADLLQDFNTFGLLFEALCIRDLRIYAQSLDGEVYHYRDKSGLEVDAIIHLRDGRWCAIEVKLGATRIDEGAGHLLEFQQKVDTDVMHAPAFLMILTGEGYAYRRTDGVYVIPIGCLRP